MFNKQKTIEAAEKLKIKLVNSKILGLTEDDVVYVVDKETNGVEFTILKGKLPTGFEGCTAKNLSKEIDDEFYQFRREGNVFTQPQAGSFTIGIKDKINESYFSFKDFLNKSTI